MYSSMDLGVIGSAFTWSHELLLPAIVGHEIELCARDALELCGAFRAGKIVADEESVALKFIDRRESLAMVRSFGAGNSHALGLAGGIESVSALVRFVSDEDFILTVGEFEADAPQDGLGHRLSAQVGLGRRPSPLNCFGVVRWAGSERGQ